MIDALAKEHGVDLSVPYEELPKKFQQELLYGTGNRHLKYTYTSRSTGAVSHRDHPFEGMINNVERRYRETSSDFMKEKMQKYMVVRDCPDCGGKRLKPEVLAVTIDGKNIAEVSDMSIRDAYNFIDQVQLSEKEEMIGHQIIKEIKSQTAVF